MLYTKSGDVNIAYGVVGDGPFDLVFVSGSVGHCRAQRRPRPVEALLPRGGRFSQLNERSRGAVL